MPQISIIIPVYKVEKYIRRCVQGILSQSFKNYELILVDDGSPDGSGLICDYYAQIDSRVKVVHKNNGGVATARNIGLENATGDYVIFVDADDEIVPQALESFSEIVKRYPGVDIIQGGATGIGGTWVPVVDEYWEWPDFQNSQEWVAEVLLHRTSWGIWSKMFKRDIIEKNNIRFIPNIIMGEDQLFLFFFQFHAHSLALCRQDTYIYHQDNEGSVMHNIDKTNSYCSEIRVAEEAVLYLKEKVTSCQFYFICRFLGIDNYLRYITFCEDKSRVQKQIKESCNRVLHSSAPVWAKMMFVFLTLPECITKRRIFQSLYYRLANLLR
jgi:putative capsular polysaccharide biosythesis protein cpsI